MQAFQEDTASNSWENSWEKISDLGSEPMIITENPRIREKLHLSEVPVKVEVEIGQVKLRQIL